MPKQRAKRGRGKRVKKLRGKGKFGDFLRKANAWLKKTKIVSNVAGALGSAGVPYASTVGNLASMGGYGKRKRKMKGKGKIGDWLRKGNEFLKRTKIISRAAKSIDVPSFQLIGKMAEFGGYGRKRRMRGRGIGHLYTPQSGVGIAGTATYSTGRVQF